MYAYDYNQQKWVEGEAARKLLIEQAGEEISLLEGPRGHDYARRIPDDRLARIDRMKRVIARLTEGDNQ